jgi:hypothetical protein
MSSVQIPGGAVDPEAKDVAGATQAMLESVQLLPTPEDLKKTGTFGALFKGSPQSIAVIEASATAFSKYWTLGLGAAAAAAWPAMAIFWKGQDEANQRTLMIGLAIAIAAVVLAIGYIVGSDVRGRSAASVATIEAREAVATAMISAAQSAYEPPASTHASQPVALPAAMKVRNTEQSGDAERGWVAIALRLDAGKTRYLLVKAGDKQWVEERFVQFEPEPAEPIVDLAALAAAALAAANGGLAPAN